MKFYLSPTFKTEVEERFAKIVARAAKIGVELTAFPTYTIEAVEVRDRFNGRYTKDILTVEIEDFNVALPGGWNVVGAVDHTPAGNIIRKIADVEVPESYKTDEATCDHCNLIRNRVTTVIVRNAAGEFVRVGKVCVSDFLGVSAEKLIPFMDEIKEFGDAEEWEARGRKLGPDVHTVLMAAAVCIRSFGWVSKTYANERTAATAEIVYDFLFNEKNWSGADRETYAKSVAALSGTEADEALAWLDAQADNDYIHNLKVAVQLSEVSSRHHGLVVSLMGVWQRSKLDDAVKAAEAAAKGPDVPSKFVGEPGDKKVPFNGGELLFRSLQEGYSYGAAESIYALVKFGNNVVEFKTNIGTDVGHALNDMVKGDMISVVGTIKGHKFDKKNREITQVFRAKIA